MKALPAHSFKIIPLALAVTLAGCGGGSGSSDDQATTTLTLPTITSGYMAYQVNDGGWQQVTETVEVALADDDLIDIISVCNSRRHTGSLAAYANHYLGRNAIEEFASASETSFYKTGNICHEIGTDNVEATTTFQLEGSSGYIADAAFWPGSYSASGHDDYYELSMVDTDSVNALISFTAGEYSDDYSLYCAMDVPFTDGGEIIISSEANTVVIGDVYEEQGEQDFGFYSGAAVAGQDYRLMVHDESPSYAIVDYSAHPGCDVLNWYLEYPEIDSADSDFYVVTYQIFGDIEGIRSEPSQYSDTGEETSINLTGFISRDSSIPKFTVNDTSSESLVFSLYIALNVGANSSGSYYINSFLDNGLDSVEYEVIDLNTLPGISLPAEVTPNSRLVDIMFDYSAAGDVLNTTLEDGMQLVFAVKDLSEWETYDSGSVSVALANKQVEKRLKDLRKKHHE